MQRNCNECGSSSWNEVWSEDYPERRNERNRTVKTLYTCENCSAEGKHFEHNEGDVFTGAMR